MEEKKEIKSEVPAEGFRRASKDEHQKVKKLIGELEKVAIPVEELFEKKMKPEMPEEEKKEAAAAETKPAAVMLLTKEALKMVHTILGRGFIREHSKEWQILKSRLKDEMKPIPAENEILMGVIDDLQAERRLRKERYEALPKCAACKSPKGRMMYFVTPEGEIELYHSQCGGERLLTFRNEVAKTIAEKIKKRTEEDKNYSASILVNTLGGMLATSQVENKKRVEDKEDARKMAEEKDKRKTERALNKAVYQNKKRHIRRDEPLANVATIMAAKNKK